MMAEERLAGIRVAALVTDGFEQVELTEPKAALEQAGAAVFVVSPKDDKVRAWKFTDWGESFDVDVSVASAAAEDYDALLLPGGVMNPDFLRVNEKAVAFTRAFFEQGKPIAAICHGPWTLIEAGIVRGRRLTSYPSVRTDLRNAGAQWVDEEVVVDGKLITSRKPDDIPAFNRELIGAVARTTRAA